MGMQRGSDLVLKVGDGAPSESFATVGGLRVTRFVLANPLVESNTPASGGWRTLAEAGIRSLSVVGEGAFSDSVAEEAVRGYAFMHSVNHYALHFGNGDVLSGAFQIAAYERYGTLDAEERFSLRLESAGEIVFSHP